MSNEKKPVTQMGQWIKRPTLDMNGEVNGYQDEFVPVGDILTDKRENESIEENIKRGLAYDEHETPVTEKKTNFNRAYDGIKKHLEQYIVTGAYYDEVNKELDAIAHAFLSRYPKPFPYYPPVVCQHPQNCPHIGKDHCPICHTHAGDINNPTQYSCNYSFELEIAKLQSEIVTRDKEIEKRDIQIIELEDKLNELIRINHDAWSKIYKLESKRSIFRRIFG